MFPFRPRPTRPTPEESERIVAAIRAAEAGNRGEVRVHLEPRCRANDAVARARDLYGALGMGRTVDDTAVLLYVAVDDRCAAVWAGQGIHDRPDPELWQTAIDDVAEGFRQGDGIGGIEAALEAIGDVLREHAAGDDTSGNELPDAVTHS